LNAKRILVVGNHTCGNRGDSAILRGLIEALQSVLPGSELTMTSRYPISSEYLLGRPFVPDRLYDFHRHAGAGLLGKIKAAAARKGLPRLLSLAMRSDSLESLGRLLPRHYRAYLEWVKQFDLVVQVGGSFFVDLYGATQFEHALLAILARRPLFMLGHSVGPFEDPAMRHLAADVFARVDALVLREKISAGLLASAGIDVPHLIQGADTAWLVKPPLGGAAVRSPVRDGRPVIAMTLRNLSPFDRRLGVSQADFECVMAKHMNALIAEGFQILAVSTCTGIDSYANDDRMCALRVQKQIERKEYFSVLMDEVNDVELGQLLQGCEFVIGTRLHSAIIAMNFGVVAMALNYEHKSQGIMEQLGMPELACSIAEVWTESFVPRILGCLESREVLRNRVASAVERERALAQQAITLALTRT
jgi:colanic acid/amylovoran biosynthesis protein